MQSADTNIFIHYHDAASPWHDKALDYMESIATDRGFCVCSYMLVELYNQLRNQALFAKPHSAKKAAEVCMTYKSNPHWAYVDYMPKIDDALWTLAAKPNVARRKIYDARMAITLLRSGVTEFATANVRDFKGLGFQRVWNPLEEG